MVLALLLVVAATYYGWGLSGDAQTQAVRSIRSGGLHSRGYGGGGPRYGK